MIKSCLSLLAGAYALHFTSFTSNYALLPVAVVGAGIAWVGGGRSAAAWFIAGFALFASHAQYVIGLRLAPSSRLIDAGTDVGLPYHGSAPDLGAFEKAP